MEDDAEPLLTAVGAEESGTVVITFTAAQLSSLTYSDVVGSNNYWLTIGGIDANSLARVVRGGTVEIVPCPFISDEGTTVTGIMVEDDMATLTFNDVTYTFAVSEIETPEGAVEGQAIVIDDMLVITIDGVSYTTPVSPL
jgi:hypothetical protein